MMSEVIEQVELDAPEQNQGKAFEELDAQERAEYIPEQLFEKNKMTRRLYSVRKT